MRFLKCVAILSLSLMATCVVAERQYPLPQLSQKDRKKDLCIERISFFGDAEFSEPLDHSLLDEEIRKESLETLKTELRNSRFEVSECRPDSLHLKVDVGLRNCIVAYFLVARVRGHDGKDREVLQFCTETPVRSGKEAEVRRAGNELAKKVGQNLAKILTPKPQ